MEYEYGHEHWRVYCPTVGYTLRCGKYFRFESQADHYALKLRRAGHMAWVERSATEQKKLQPAIAKAEGRSPP
jgi:hypothetical protein